MINFNHTNDINSVASDMTEIPFKYSYVTAILMTDILFKEWNDIWSIFDDDLFHLMDYTRETDNHRYIEIIRKGEKFNIHAYNFINFLLNEKIIEDRRVCNVYVDDKV